MRLTTKIVAGIILSFFLLTIAYITVRSFAGKNGTNEHPNGNIISSENTIGLEVKPYKTVMLTCDPIDSKNFMKLAGSFTLQPTTNDDEVNKLFISEELSRFIAVESAGDTLVIKAKMQEVKKEFFDNRRIMSSRIHGANFKLYTNDIDMISNQSEINIVVRNIKSGQIKLITSSNALIENCKADLVEPEVTDSWKNLELKNSQIKELVIDLDKIGKWSITDCSIGEGNFTGSKKNHQVQLLNSKMQTMTWNPKKKYSSLGITLPGDTTRIVFP